MTAGKIGTQISRYSKRKATYSRQRKGSSMGKKERQHLTQLAVCAAIFFSMVVIKLVLPQRMVQLRETLNSVMEQNMDVKAVFSAVGRGISGEQGLSGTLEEVYQAVFHPQDGEAVETAAWDLGLEDTQTLLNQSAQGWQPASWRVEAGKTEEGTENGTQTPPESAQPVESSETTGEASGQATVSQLVCTNLPEGVRMEQAVLDFSYCSPIVGVLSSSFGYREHPIEGEERFHYGVDLAADTGTAVGCFADGTVTAVGESSSLGKYVTVAHENGYSTLYAHCSKTVVNSGASVTRGEKIAEVGETGMATGPHLHFELHNGSEYLNPIYYVTLS
ncbi:M23 family metallopeptidase [Oscillibacter hominis]|uniref:M23 family metallopeptidase n=2 Tax=Oscillibacter hominis TaxID=2763056 RepID=A0A7G9B821_9FIRM|nr:M23 family metallopeptidase [Oscillibacter hominis]